MNEKRETIKCLELLDVWLQTQLTGKVKLSKSTLNRWDEADDDMIGTWDHPDEGPLVCKYLLTEVYMKFR